MPRANALSAELIEMKVDLARLETLSEIVSEMVKPAEKIDSIKIHQVTGMGGASFGGTVSRDKPVVNLALDSILGMAVQLPALKKSGEELGLSMENSIGDIAEGGLVREAPHIEITSDDGDQAKELATEDQRCVWAGTRPCHGRRPRLTESLGAPRYLAERPCRDPCAFYRRSVPRLAFRAGWGDGWDWSGRSTFNRWLQSRSSKLWSPAADWPWRAVAPGLGEPRGAAARSGWRLGTRVKSQFCRISVRVGRNLEITRHKLDRLGG